MLAKATYDLRYSGKDTKIAPCRCASNHSAKAAGFVLGSSAALPRMGANLPSANVAMAVLGAVLEYSSRLVSLRFDHE